MRQRSCLPSLAILQAHGLTAALLEKFAEMATHAHTGAFLFRVHEGHIQGGEMRQYWRGSRLEEERRRQEETPRSSR